MEEFKPNSHKYKESQKNKATERKTLEKVTKGKVTVKKKSEIRKFADVFVSEDVHKVKSFVIMEVLVPAVKKAISDIVVNGIDMILYGETGRTKKSSASRISYSKYYDDRRYDRSYEPATVRPSYDSREVVFETRGEAEEVLARLDELIESYGIASVADFHDLAGVTGEYTDIKYGWTNIRDAYVARVRDGYIIKFPRVKPL